MNVPCLITAACIVLGSGVSGADDHWSLAVPGKTLHVSGKMLDPMNVSGLASVGMGQLVFACDELKHEAQAGRLDPEKMEIIMDENPIILLTGLKKELDLEDAAADPEHHCYYVCGSCSVSRKTGQAAPNRQWLFRIGTHPQTGLMLPDKVTKVSLAGALRTDAILAAHLDKSAADLGIDVEGIAFKDGRLWFGLRSPNVNDRGLVLAVPADDIMAGKPVVFQCFELPLGHDLGIRSIATIRDGFLLIAGPTGALESDKGGFSLCYWAGNADPPVRVGGLPRPPRTTGGKDGKGKPEGLLVMSESNNRIGLIVVSDDAENGAPTLYEVTRPPPRNGNRIPEKE